MRMAQFVDNETILFNEKYPMLQRNTLNTYNFTIKNQIYILHIHVCVCVCIILSESFHIIDNTLE